MEAARTALGGNFKEDVVWPSSCPENLGKMSKKGNAREKNEKTKKMGEKNEKKNPKFLRFKNFIS